MKKNSGKKFEELIKKSALEQNFDFNRMRDAGYQGEQTQRRFTIRNICDMTLFKNGKLFYIEAKSGQTSIAFSRLTQHKDLAKKHAEGITDVHVGYLFEIKGEVFYISYFDMDCLMKRIGKASINKYDLIKHRLNKIIPPRKKVERIDLSGLPLNEIYN